MVNDRLLERLVNTYSYGEKAKEPGFVAPDPTRLPPGDRRHRHRITDLTRTRLEWYDSAVRTLEQKRSKLDPESQSSEEIYTDNGLGKGYPDVLGQANKHFLVMERTRSRIERSLHELATTDLHFLQAPELDDQDHHNLYISFMYHSTFIDNLFSLIETYEGIRIGPRVPNRHERIIRHLRDEVRGSTAHTASRHELSTYLQERFRDQDIVREFRALRNLFTHDSPPLELIVQDDMRFPSLQVKTITVYTPDGLCNEPLFEYVQSVYSHLVSSAGTAIGMLLNLPGT